MYEYKARSRSVYFPEGRWYDFYTGVSLPGGRRLTVEAPYERIPLYVRAGSIIPVGPAMEWSDQKPADKLLLVIYAGADADFTLYEDDGLSYGYERGEYATIRLHWDDEAGLLNIGPREGAFPGMLQERTFCVAVVRPGAPWAFDPDANTLCINYKGNAFTVGL